MIRAFALLSPLLSATVIGVIGYIGLPPPAALNAAADASLRHVDVKQGAPHQPFSGSPQEQAAFIAALHEPIVRVNARSVANARSNAELGRQREGSGIVVDRAGYIVTSFFLVQEPDAIEVTTSKGRTVPAALVSQDERRGIAILKATLPLEVAPMTLGKAAELAVREAVLVISAVKEPEVAFVVARREFAGTWEYLVDDAIIVAPAAPGWSGAALIDSGGNLIGVGLLLVKNAVAGHPGQVPGNMFVPIEAVETMLHAIRNGRAEAQAPMPWLGLVTQEFAGRLIVCEVPPESPAEHAGLRQGDIILAVGEAEVSSHADLYRRIWGSGRPGADVPLTVLRGARVQQVSLRAIAARDYLAQKAML